MLRKISKIIISLIIMMILSFGFSIKGEITLAKSSKSACLLETTTLDVLYDKNASTRLFPASMTKIMSIKIILDNYAKCSFSMDDMVTTSEYASSMGGSQIFLSVSEKMKVADLLKSVIIASANDACVALAEYVAGSEEAFVEMMNQEVIDLGLKNTHFANCTGLPINNHYTSAYDIAVIASSLLNTHGEIVLPISSKYEDFVRVGTPKQFWLVNTNKLVRYVEGIDGLKTGWTVEAGYCLTATMKKDDMRLVAVSMGCESAKERNSDIVELLNYGMSNYEMVSLYKKGDVVKVIEDIKITPHLYHLVVGKDVNIVKKKSEKLKNITNDIVDSKMRVYVDDNLYQEVDLVSETVLKKASFLEIFFNLIKQIFG